MKEFEIKTTIREYSFDELSAEDRKLCEIAKDMTRNSYAPFSEFHVGAAILLANGEIVRGANQENAAFSSGTCAERSACFQAGAIYPDVPFKKIAIACWTRRHHDASEADEACFLEEPGSPCGACRQALMEYEALYGPIEVLLAGRDKVWVVPSVASLLPLTFSEF